MEANDENKEMKTVTGPQRLAPDQADLVINSEVLNFETTEQVEPLDEIIGQSRAMEALDVGLGINQEGYNIFVAGLTGTGKMETIHRSLQKRLDQAPVPNDWIYVHNFDKTDEPWAIELPAGKARQFKRDMSRLVEHLQEEIPKAFKQEDFSQEKERLASEYQKRFQEEMERLNILAREKGFQMTPGPQGNIFFIPLINGKPPEKEEQLEALPEEEKKRIQESQQELTKEATKLLHEQRDHMLQLREEVHDVERKFGAHVVQPSVGVLKRKYQEQARIQQYLEYVTQHLLDNLSDFRQGGKKEAQPGPIPGMMLVEDLKPKFLEYQVNIVVDHCGSKTAPIILEEAPTFRNIFGTIEKTVDLSGRMVTDFTRIKAGSLLQANGGFLVFNLDDALTEPLVYKNLKRILKSGRIHFETYDSLLSLHTTGLRPEPIPIDTKVVVLGSPLLHYMLRLYDDDFGSIFKVKADFGTEMPGGSQEQYQYARFVAMLTREEKLRVFTREAVEEIIRFGARGVSQKGKLLTRFAEIADIIRESDFIAQTQNSQVVKARHVQKALQSRIFRSDRIAEKIRELIADGTILVDCEGSKIGRVNGLAVFDLGDYAFGKPNRVTASVGLGTEGLINIEREAKLSGSTHDKGVLILGGYLRNTYGKDKPLTLSASICFEQSYGGVDGDSASSTELYTLLSLLAEVPLRQDLAVTGSINQWGEIQAVGGINEKIEGFFDLCRIVGLTGRQGVCIPKSNVKNLVLRNDVRQALADNKFHIYPIETVDEGLELLSGIKAGSCREEGTFHWLVDRRLREMAEQLRAFGPQRQAVSVLTGQEKPPPPAPPKLPDDQP